MIPFNRPTYTGNEDCYVMEAMRSEKMSGGGVFTQKCEAWFEGHLKTRNALLTPSCTHALEMAAMLLDIAPGDEIIMPSYTFVSTANAFVLRGGVPVFVDIRPDTMNMDEALIEAAITPKTRAIVPVHYGGVACDMDAIMALAAKHSLCVVEDAAQGMMASYKSRALGSIGHLGCISFHDTKNYTAAGEGGLLAINDERFVKRAEVLREKGTNRSAFLREEIDKYTWLDIGSSMLPGDVQAAYLWGQIERADEIAAARHAVWTVYSEMLGDMHIPDACAHNAHMFYIKTAERDSLMAHLKAQGIQTASHYVPLHTSGAGRKFACFHGQDIHTSAEAAQLLRLPLWYGLKPEDARHIAALVLKARS